MHNSEYTHTQTSAVHVSPHHLHVLCVCVYSDEVPNDLSGRLYHLEVMLKQLNTDLERVSVFCFSLVSLSLGAVRSGKVENKGPVNKNS